MIIDQFIIDYDVYMAVEKYNHDEHYDYAKDKSANLFKCHYGHCGDGDWHITCYESVNDQHKIAHMDADELIYYKRTDRLPFDYITQFSWQDVKGLLLDIKEINGKQQPCFIRWSDNKCFLIE